MKRLLRLLESAPSPSGIADLSVGSGSTSMEGVFGSYPTPWGYAVKKGTAGTIRMRYNLISPGEVLLWDRRSGQAEKDAVKMTFKDFDKEWRAL